MCSQNTCDPKIDKLYKNTSVIEEENLQKIDRINRDNEWVAGRTSFLSLSYSEVQAYRMGEIPHSREDREQTQDMNNAKTDFLASLESKRKNRFKRQETDLEVVSTDANNQGECSACSAFAVTAAMEICIRNPVLPSVAESASARLQKQNERTSRQTLFNSQLPPTGLSSQNMLDCAFGSSGLFGCDGGKAFNYLSWLKDGSGSFDTNRQYSYQDGGIRYEGLNNTYRKCYQSSGRPAAVLTESHNSWDDHTERDLENILQEGHAIITTMHVPDDLLLYKSGVYQSSECDNWSLGLNRSFQWENSWFKPLRHAVVIVGFGVEQGNKYWKVKNSWGENWGTSGFFKIIRNGLAHCGLGAYFSVALCKQCFEGVDCKPREQRLEQPATRPPSNLPEEGISAGFTTFQATPLSAVGLVTCPICAGSQGLQAAECPSTHFCRTRGATGDKCCLLVGGSGNKLYCPTNC